MIIFIFTLCPTIANAGIALGGTRLIYEDNKNSASIDVLNTDRQIYLIQSWIESSDNSPVPFVLTPPLFKISKKSQRSLRIMKISSSLPGDRESLFWLNVKAIPLTENTGSSIQVAVKTRIKLFFRPKKLNSPPPDIGEKLSWSLHQGELTVTNPTPYYMSFYSVEFNNTPLKEIKMIAPMTTARFALPGNDVHGVLTWKIINDYGVTSQIASSNI